MRKIKELKKWINGYSGVKTAIEELQLAYDFYREEVATEEEVDEAYRLALEQIETLELQNMLSKEEDQFGAVIKIVAGAGGTEAQDWEICFSECISVGPNVRAINAKSPTFRTAMRLA